MLKCDTIWYRSNLQFAITVLQYVIFLIYWFRFSELASNSCLAFAIFHLLQLNSLHCSGNDVGENPACRFRMENGEIGTFQVNITMSQITML